MEGVLPACVSTSIVCNLRPGIVTIWRALRGSSQCGCRSQGVGGDKRRFVGIFRASSGVAGLSFSATRTCTAHLVPLHLDDVRGQPHPII